MAKTSKANGKPKLRTFNLSELTLTNPQNAQPVYSNSAAITFGNHDFRILFAEVINSIVPNAAPAMEMRASVAMSPTHFKALFDAMGTTLQRFEEQFGKIKWPLEEKPKSLKM
jgi:hypothetical protein